MDTLTRFYDSWWTWALAASWQLAVFVLLIALVAGLSRRLSARFRYALWTLVLIKVFLPPSLGLPWSVGSWAGGVLPEPPVAGVAREAPPAALRDDSGRGPGAPWTVGGLAGGTEPPSRGAPEAEPDAVPAGGEAGLESGFEPRESAAERAGPALAARGRASAWSDLPWPTSMRLGFRSRSRRTTANSPTNRTPIGLASIPGRTVGKDGPADETSSGW